MKGSDVDRKELSVVSKNIAEDLIDMYLDQCMRKASMCQCIRCRADVRAYALNHFPAYYAVTTLGDLIVRTKILSTQSQADILTAIMKGIKVVSDNPRHEKETERS
ncbi:MAG: late competence development ComFB family protein [Christensenellales bacterium]